MLLELAEWDNRPNCLRTMAYEWCSAICEAYEGLWNGGKLLFASLKVGFRGLDIQNYFAYQELVHTKHHRDMAKIVFNGGDDEVIADLLQAWTGAYHDSDMHELLGLADTLPRLFIRHQHQISTSRRLRLLVIHSVGYLGPEQVEQVGMEEFTELLDCLSVGIDDMDWLRGPSGSDSWVHLLSYVIESPQRRRSLPHPYWELMIELLLAVGYTEYWDRFDDDLRIMLSLEEEEEWDKLECWTGSVWLRRRPGIYTIREDLERVTLSLFRRRPGAVQKLEQWLERSRASESLECLQLICKREGIEVVSWQDIP